MMEMTGLESALDPGMFFLDVIAGTFGSLLYYTLLGGVDNFKPAVRFPIDVFGVVVSRVIIDLGYHFLIDSEASFGGSYAEFALSSVVFFAMYAISNRLVKNKQSGGRLFLQFIMILLVMLATARVTHWG